MKPLLEIKNLTVKTREEGKVIVNGISLKLEKNSIQSIVGASGSGKSTTGFAVLNLLAGGLLVTGGRIEFNGSDLLRMPQKKLQTIRGGKISMIFQDPLDAFNPVFTIGHQIDEVLRTHTSAVKTKRREEVRRFLDLAGLKEVDRVAQSYPHQLSGGMRQRAMIAQAICAQPKIVIADEPTSNLDVTLQAKIMALFKHLRKKMDLSILLISHDLGMVSHLADTVAVMQNGNIVERGVTAEVIQNPAHEYTQRLMKRIQVQ